MKVGFNIAIAGVFASLGDPQKKAVDLAVQWINDRGGVLGRQIEPVIHDNEGDQTRAEQLALRMIDQDQVAVIFGPNVTPPALVLAPLMERRRQLLITWVAQEFLANGTTYVFQALPAQHLNADGMVQLAVDRLNRRTAAILYANVPYGQNGRRYLVEASARRSLAIVAEEKWDEQGFSFSPQVGRVVAAKPDVIFVWGSAASADGLVIKQLRAAGWRGPIIGDIAIALPSIFSTAGSDNIEGVYSFSWLDYNSADAETRAFIEAYSSRHREPPPVLATAAWDGLFIYKAAVEKAGSFDPARVAEALARLEHKGVAGLYRFSPENHTGFGEDAYRVIQAREGRFVPLGSPEPGGQDPDR